MASFSLRLMLVFMFAALVLNASNYLFVRVYNAARNRQYKAIKYDWISSSDATEVKSFLVERTFWSEVVECDEKNTSRSSNNHTDNDSQPESTTAPYIVMATGPSITTDEEEMEKCPELPPGLGPELEDPTLIYTQFRNYFKPKLDEVKLGGIYQPSSCKSLQSVAIIIAYRGCKSYLSTFMDTLHTFLIKQQLEYQIFVVEQTNKTQAFNRGKLLNVGFTEATRSRKGGFRCIIFHEPHIVPVDSRNLYRCGWYPKQLASFVERPAKAPYIPLLGGVVAITPELFFELNGFSNAYWRNDADYYDLYNRIIASNYYLEKSLPIVGKYIMIRKGVNLWTRSHTLSTQSPQYLLDGLTSLSYTVDNLELRRLFTYLRVNIDVEVETENRAKINDTTTESNSYISNQTANESTYNE